MRLTRRRGDRALTALARALLVLVVAFLLLPAVVIVTSSFSGAEFMQFPPRTWGLRQYRTFAASPAWLGTIKTSVMVALPAAAVATGIGLLSVFALYRTRVPGAGFLLAASLSSLIIPVSAYAVALYGLLLQLGLVGTFLGLVIAHTAQGVALVVLTLGGAISRIPRELELVAMTLGASRPQAWMGITLRLLAPALASAYIFAFLNSFDEATIVNFVAGPDVVTLPKAIFDSVQFGIDPVVTAIGTLLMAVTVALVLVTNGLRRRRA